MTVHLFFVVLALVIIVGLAASIGWFVYVSLPEKVFLRDQMIVRKYGGKQQEMPVSDISEIKYHYHAVVGFVAVWEFIGTNADRLLVDGDAKGVDDLLNVLEKVLTGFSLVRFKRRFDEGDVVDVIDIWKAA